MHENPEQHDRGVHEEARLGPQDAAREPCRSLERDIVTRQLQRAVKAAKEQQAAEKLAEGEYRESCTAKLPN